MSTNNVVVITDCPDLTSAVYRGLKQYSKQTKTKDFTYDNIQTSSNVIPSEFSHVGNH